MKNNILIVIFLVLTSNILAQNIKDHKISFKYIQLPQTPLDKSIKTYEVQFNSEFDKANEDSISAYNLKIESAKLKQESELETWTERKIRTDKLHLAEMAKWEKAVNAGNDSIVMPVKKKYDAYPMLEEVSLPLLTEDVEESSLLNKISLYGYVKGSDGAIVSFTFYGLQKAEITMKKQGSGATTNYKYEAITKMPIKATFNVPSKGSIYEKTYYFNEQTSLLKKEKSKYDYELWWMDNKNNYWKSKQANMISSAVTSFNTTINDKYGFPVKSVSAEIYVVKKYKKYNYDEFVTALSDAKVGYREMQQSADREESISKLNKAIAVWQKELKQSDINNGKARINKKITALLYANLATAYLWSNDFDNAELYINKALTIGVLKYKNHCKRLQSSMSDLKLRYDANQ